MRKLWPPTYDDFSVRMWAAIVSVMVNSLLWAFMFLGAQGAFWWLVPGVLPAAAISAIAGYNFEGPTIPVIAAFTCIVADFGFYYLISWVLINMFTRSTDWWPTKRP